MSLCRGTSFRTRARGWHRLVSEGRINDGTIQVYSVHFTVPDWLVYKGRWCEKLASECLSRELIFPPLHVTAESIGADGSRKEYGGDMEALGRGLQVVCDMQTTMHTTIMASYSYQFCTSSQAMSSRLFQFPTPTDWSCRSARLRIYTHRDIRHASRWERNHQPVD